MGQTAKTKAYVTDKSIVPNGKSVTHKIDFKYDFKGQTYVDHYYSNGRISDLNKGDSLILQVSISDPTKCKVTGFYPNK